MNLPTTIEGCHELILKQQVSIEQLTARLKEVEIHLNKNSENSNKPPSMDGLTKKPALPKKHPKKRGGQRGHKGNKLQLVDREKVDEIHPLYPSDTHCTCGEALDKGQAVLKETRQEFDLPEPCLLIRGFEKMEITCTCCGTKHGGEFPAHIKASTQYGSRVKTLMVLLNSGFGLPVKKTKSLFEDLFGYSINESTIVNYTKECYHKLASSESYTKKQLESCQVGHSDETGIRVEGNLGWLHVFANSLFSFFFAHPKRGKIALEDEQSILPNFGGWVVHDCWKSYFKFEGAKHALCGAHLLRELYALEEQGGIWAKWFTRCLLTLLHLTEQNGGVLNEQQQQKALKLYERICQLANDIEPPPKKTPGKKGRPKGTVGRNLLDRLMDHQNAVLAFAFHLEVPFTNNQAERDLRPMKTKLKVAGCFRTFDGAKKHARIYGFIATVRKHQLNIFDQLKAVFDNRNPDFLFQGGK